MSVMAVFGAFSVAVALYAGFQLKSIDTGYSNLLAREAATGTNTVRMNRALQSARASIGDIIMSRTEEASSTATADLELARADFEKFADAAIKASQNDPELQALKAEGLKLLDVVCKGTILRGAAARDDTTIAAAQTEFLAQCQPGLKQISAQFISKTKAVVDSAEAGSGSLSETSDVTVTTTITLVLVGLALVVAGGFFAMRIWLVHPIKKLADTMVGLADGDLSIAVEGVERKDEIGGMAKAVQIFKENGLAARELEREANAQRDMTEEERRRNAEKDRARAEDMAHATDGLANGLKHLASGDLTFQLQEAFAADFESLRSDFNGAVAQLSRTLAAVSQSTTLIDGGTREISQSAQDLAKRTEQQAASLEETAAALDQITTNVANSSKRAEEARSIAAQANASAAQSGAVVANAVNAMQRIEQSSNQIANIIGVIDEIAFQTNLLALNAGVEAARAGEAGKGFAVVAQEVRELAQRSAQAAKEIKGLIQNSTVEVSGGVKLVSDTGEALKAIEKFIVTINEHMEAIATSAREQSVGLAEVNTAVNQMDQVTQQNAAMVEESTAASSSLATEAVKLKDLVGEFRLPAVGADRTSMPRSAPFAVSQDQNPAPSPARKLVNRIAGSFGSSAVVHSNWEEF